MNDSFCTICTVNYLGNVHALANSIRLINKEYILHVLVIECRPEAYKPFLSNIRFYYWEDIDKQEFAYKILEKYGGGDSLRWALKPVFMSYLLKHHTKRVIYVDNDICFFRSPDFLFKLLWRNRLLLTPHWRCKNPSVDENNFLTNFTDGVFNAGFIGANKKADEILRWWASGCCFRMEKDKKFGLWDDQKYLDLLPSIFEGIEIVRHRGCNVAIWNKLENIRVWKNNDVLINGKFPIIFIHFTADTIADITEDTQGGDPYLRPYFLKYQSLKAIEFK